MQSTEAVHTDLVWKARRRQLRILFHSRFSKYMVKAVADPAVIDAGSAGGALTMPRFLTRLGRLRRRGYLLVARRATHLNSKILAADERGTRWMSPKPALWQ